MEWDLEPTGAPAPLVSVRGVLIQEIGAGPVGVAPPAPSGGAQDLPPSRAPPADKRCPGLGPGSFLVVSPAFSALQGLLEVVGESERPEAEFPFLASCPSWPPSSLKSQLVQTLKASSAKVDSGAWGPVSSFCNSLQVSGISWVIKRMASGFLPSVDSGSVWVSFLNAFVAWLRKTAGFSFFLVQPLGPYHNLQVLPYSFSFILIDK